MVTYFNRKDLVSFANWYADKINIGEKLPDPDGNYRVTHTDIENWLETQK